jgi:FAD/FMN-containing dehydrogenase
MPEKMIAQLIAIVGAANVLQGADAAAYETDWRKRYHGKALAVVRPANTSEVAAVVRLCSDTGTSIVTQGGNTGLVGGATPDGTGTQLILSLARMQRVRELDTANDTLTVEAGCVLQAVQDTAANAQRLFPLCLAAEGSCTIGGNLATNAGGTQVLRYGNARELCLGLEVVTASGEIWQSLKGLRKDNTGYDLRDLFIGSEGTLGIITAATLKLLPLPAAKLTAFVAVTNVAAAVQLLSLAKSQLGAGLTGFELISRYCLTLVTRHYPQLPLPLPQGAAYYVLLELCDHESEAHAQAAFERLLETALAHSIISDAAIAQNIAQSRQFWHIRESIPLAQAEEGLNIKHDISLPISRIAQFVETVGAQLESEFKGSRLVNFGHVGDGNLHFNLQAPSGVNHAAFLAANQTRCNDIVHDAVHAHGGSISAEHGVGQLKAALLPRYKSEVELAMMRRIKQALDPQNLLNPGKVLA